MTDKQLLHIAMENSYNIVTGATTLEDILNTDMIIFCHHPEEPIDYPNLSLMIIYYEKIEHYEKCQKLKEIVDNLFIQNSSIDPNECKCDLPSIKKYATPMVCGSCKKVLNY